MYNILVSSPENTHVYTAMCTFINVKALTSRQGWSRQLRWFVGIRSDSCSGYSSKGRNLCQGESPLISCHNLNLSHCKTKFNLLHIYILVFPPDSTPVQTVTNSLSPLGSRPPEVCTYTGVVFASVCCKLPVMCATC